MDIKKSRCGDSRRRGWDSNPRYPEGTRALQARALGRTMLPLHIKNIQLAAKLYHGCAGSLISAIFVFHKEKNYIRFTGKNQNCFNSVVHFNKTDDHFLQKNDH